MHWENLFGYGRITPLMVKISDNISGIVEPVPSSKYYIVNGISFYLAGVVRTVLLPAGSTVGKAWGQIMVKPSLEHYSLQYVVSPQTYKKYCKHCHCHF